MYQPYPPAGQPAEPPRPPAPAPALTAVKLIYAGAAASTVNLIIALAYAALVVVVLAACTARAGSTAPARQARGQPPPCTSTLPPVQPTPAPTTVTTIEQAYYCVFAHYYAGPVLDDRVLLAGAFAGFTQELDRLGMDQPDATMPALTGDRGRDWTAFAAVYQKVTSQAPASPAQRQALAAAMTGMIASLDDNHAVWGSPPPLPPGYPAGDVYGLGITTSPGYPLAVKAPQEALPPLSVFAVDPGSPADGDGVRPGDVIVSVNGAPPFADGVLSEGAMNLLFAPYPQASVRLQRPATGRTWTVTLTPALYPGPPLAASAKLLDGDIAYLQLPGFYDGAAQQVLQAIQNLAGDAKLRGLILDLRGNLGGSTSELSELLGAFTHGAAWGYNCDVHGRCTASYPDSNVPLLHLRLVVLTDRNCLSACDLFSGAVKDLRLGTLVGTRTSGIVAGAADLYLLDDASLLDLPATHLLGADHELINGIGVAPGYYLPLTAQDLSAGHDPDITKALTLLGG